MEQTPLERTFVKTKYGLIEDRDVPRITNVNNTTSLFLVIAMVIATILLLAYIIWHFERCEDAKYTNNWEKWVQKLHFSTDIC